MPIVLDVKKGEYPKFSQATEDIIVYKVLLFKNSDIKSKPRALFYDNFTWRIDIKEQEIGVFKTLPGKTTRRNYLISNEGLYSFNNLKDAQRFHDVFSEAKQFIGFGIGICKAIIPTGSMYLKHKGQMISNKLILLRNENETDSKSNTQL